MAVERQRVAGDEGARRVVRVDQPRALLGVSLRQQALARNLHECGITVIGVAVRVGELERLDHGVEIVRAVELHRPQVEIFKDVERLQQRRPLAAEGMLVDLIAAVGGHCRLVDAGEELGKIGDLERGFMSPEEGHHLGRDVALVEAVARSHDAGTAALRLVGALGLDHAGERAGQRREADGVAGPVARSVGFAPVALVVRPRPR